MARTIKIMVGEAELFSINIDGLEDAERDLITRNLQTAQDMIEKGKPARAVLYVGAALIIPNAINVLDGEN